MLGVKAYYASYIVSEIAESLVLSQMVYREVSEGPGKISAMLRCAQSGWCNSVCNLTDSSLVLTSLEISGGMNIAAEITCFTPRRRVLFPSESAILSGWTGEADREMANLNTGTYDLQLPSCYYALSEAQNPYFLVEFPTVRKISGVTMRNQGEGSFDKFLNFEVRVGNVSTVGDFSQNELLGTVIGPQTSHNVDIVVERKVPLEGKFVTFEELGGIRIFICMLEIY